MASVPQSMMMARSKKKKIQKGLYLQSADLEERYNNKMMDSIWGQYNRYSVHNMKSMQNEEDFNKAAAPPAIQIMREHVDQGERAGSPVLQMLQQEIGRSRPLHRVMQQHKRDVERSRSPSLSELFMEDDVDGGRSSPAIMQIINDQRNDTRRCHSPLLQLAKNHYDEMGPNLHEIEQDAFGSIEHGISQNDMTFGNTNYLVN